MLPSRIPVATAFETRSSQITTRGARLRRSEFSAASLVERDVIPALQPRGLHDDLSSGLPKLVEIPTLQVPELHEQHPRLLPVPALVETDAADDRLDRVGVEPSRHLRLVQGARASRRGGDDLAGRIVERRDVVAERIDAPL